MSSLGFAFILPYTGVGKRLFAWFPFSFSGSGCPWVMFKAWGRGQDTGDDRWSAAVMPSRSPPTWPGGAPWGRNSSRDRSRGGVEGTGFKSLLLTSHLLWSNSHPLGHWSLCEVGRAGLLRLGGPQRAEAPITAPSFLDEGSSQSSARPCRNRQQAQSVPLVCLALTLSRYFCVVVDPPQQS